MRSIFIILLICFLNLSIAYSAPSPSPIECDKFNDKRPIAYKLITDINIMAYVYPKNSKPFYKICNFKKGSYAMPIGKSKLIKGFCKIKVLATCNGNISVAFIDTRYLKPVGN